MKIARYRRVSSKRQVNEGESLAGQIKKTDEWAKSNGHEIIVDYVDAGFTGRNENRKGYQHLLADVEDPESEIEAVIVYALNRISRDLLILLKGVAHLEKNNVQLFSVIENLPKDRSTNRLMLAITGAVAQNQSDTNSIFVKDCLNETAEQGFFTGGRIPYGYSTIIVKIEGQKKKRSKLVINEEQASNVRDIFNAVIKGSGGKGDGLKTIATNFNKRGLKHGVNNWTITTLGRMLHDSTYMGVRIFGKNRKGTEYQPIKSKCPAIISESTFIQAKEALKSRQLTNRDCKGNRSNSLLTGLLKCSCCNSNLIINTGKSGQYKYYKCSKKIKENISICNQKPIPQLLIENKILDVISNSILETEYLNKISEHVKKILKGKTKNDDQIRLSKENQLAGTKQSLKKLFMMLSKDQIAADKDLDEILDDLKNKRNTLEEDLQVINRRSSIPIWKFGDKKKLIFIEAIKKVLMSSDKNLTKAFLRTIITKIEVKPTEVTIIGSNMQMLNAISKTKMGTSNEVPTFVSMWR